MLNDELLEKVAGGAGGQFRENEENLPAWMICTVSPSLKHEFEAVLTENGSTE